MARTFLDLQNEALHDDFDPNKYRARVKQWLNEARAKVSRRVDSPASRGTQLLVLVAGTASYTLPDDWIETVSLVDRTGSDNAPIDEVTTADLDTLPDATGRPYYFASDSNAIVLYPTPDQAGYELHLRYVRNTTELSGDGDELPAWMEDYADLLVTYARSKLFRAEDDKAMSDSLRNDFELELGQMRADVQRPSRRVKRTAGMFRAGRALPSFRRP